MVYEDNKYINLTCHNVLQSELSPNYSIISQHIWKWSLFSNVTIDNYFFRVMTGNSYSYLYDSFIFENIRKNS